MREFEQPLNPDKETDRFFPARQQSKKEAKPEESWQEVPLGEEQEDKDEEAA